MGWTWALHIANEIVSHQVFLSSVRPGRDEVRGRTAAADVMPGAPVVATYVDNVHCFGGRHGVAGLRMEDIGQRFSRLNIPFVIDKVESQLCLESRASGSSLTSEAVPQHAPKLSLHGNSGLPLDDFFDDGGSQAGFSESGWGW